MRRWPRPRQLGYAEADPSADVEGRDAAAKLAILASIAFNVRVKMDDVYTEGISRLTTEDIHFANELGYVIKLLAIAKNDPDGISVRVHPTMIPHSHPLAAVKDVFNAVFVHGDAVGDLMFYGRGAGSLPAASAVVGDIIYVARSILSGGRGLGCTCYDTAAREGHGGDSLPLLHALRRARPARGAGQYRGGVRGERGEHQVGDPARHRA